MSPILLPSPVQFSKKQIDELIGTFQKAFANLSYDELTFIRLFDEDAIVVSFSIDYKPFLGFTKGYNHPDQRVYIPKETTILNRLGEALDSYGRDKAAGRVFIQNDRVYIKDNWGNHQVILHLKLQEFDLCKTIRILYNMNLNERSSGKSPVRHTQKPM